MGPMLVPILQVVLFALAGITLVALLVSVGRDHSHRRHDGGQMMRRHASMAGLVPAFFLCAAFAVKPLMRAGEANTLPQCVAHVRDLSGGILLYAQDFEGKMPLADNWGNAIEGYLPKARISQFHCPSSPTTNSYALNENLAEVGCEEVENPAETVLVFESSLNTANAVGARKQLTKENRHGDGMQSVATFDGRAMATTAFKRLKLKWTLKSAPTTSSPH